MFSLSTLPLNKQELESRLGDPAAGAVVVFEGRVRNHNEGRKVLRLEYEAYEALCLEEAQKILKEARDKFALLKCVAVHRVGALEIEDVAVIVGVAAAHRGEAFDACRFVIDEIKHRLPIWKKEHYVDGDSQWVNCGHAHDSSDSTESGKSEGALDVLAVSSKELREFAIVDIRENSEDRRNLLSSLTGAESVHIPLSQFDLNKPPLNKTVKYLIICQTGVRSAALALDLRKRGYANVYFVSGGAEAVRRKFIA